MFGSLLETEDEGEYARDTSAQDFASLMSEPRWKTRICGLKNQGAINLLFKFFAPEFPSSINFARLARFFRIPNEI